MRVSAGFNQFQLALCVIGITFMPGSTLAGTPPTVTQNQLPDLVERVSPGVVNISSTRFVKQWVLRGVPEFFGNFGIPEQQIERQSSLGSGFIIDANGYVLTNNHVIENAQEVVVTLADKRRFPAKIIGRDRTLDLGLLQLKGGKSIPNLKPTILGSSETVRAGESVFAIGNPFGLQNSVSAGIISAKNRSIGIGPLDDYLQTDASINFGNSGGPLFNLKGEVIGINTAINAQGQGLGFAIPIDEAKSKLKDLKDFGYVVRPWLGIAGQNISPAMQYYYDLPVDKGVVIVQLAARGPAAKSGLQVGDIITKVNTVDINERADIQRALAKIKPDDSVKVKLVRKAKPIERDVKLATAPDASELPEGVL